MEFSGEAVPAAGVAGCGASDSGAGGGAEVAGGETGGGCGWVDGASSLSEFTGKTYRSDIRLISEVVPA